MRIPYHDLDPSAFERLVVALCLELLGPGVQPFSTGPDGGRDARFEGTAVKFPSPTSALQGKFVAQAKHTENPCAKFSDSDFSGEAASAVLTEELTRVSALVAAGELEHYLLFANRRLAGVADGELRKRIKDSSGATTVELFGIERMDVLLRTYPDAVRIAELPVLTGPLLVSPDDLAEVILALDTNKAVFRTAGSLDTLRRVSFEEKNRKNGLSVDFAAQILRNYLSDFESVKRFLALPASAQVAARYDDAAAEFNEQIIAHRKPADVFDQVLVHIQHLLFSRDPDLARNRRLTKLVLYYMYWNCDIGSAD